MKCLITGGAGFIGSHLCDLLVSAGHQIIVIDDLSTGHINNIQHLIDDNQIELENVDIRNRQDLETLSDKIKNIDWVFHLAGRADIVPSVECPELYFDVNVQGTLNVLNLARKLNCKRFIYAASSSCYGMPNIFPTPEKAAISPQYPYALTKYMGEELLMHWCKIYKLPGVSLRLFNVYGPRSRTNGTYGAVFGVFLAQKIHNRPFTVVGDGQQTRDFTYVLDVASAFVAAVQSQEVGEIFNVGSGHHYSVNYLVQLLGGEVEYIPKRPGEPECTYADISKIQEKLAWSAEVSFEEGVSKMLVRLEDWSHAPLWEASAIQKVTAPWFSALGQNG